MSGARGSVRGTKLYDCVNIGPFGGLGTPKRPKIIKNIGFGGFWGGGVGGMGEALCIKQNDALKTERCIDAPIH